MSTTIKSFLEEQKRDLSVKTKEDTQRKLSSLTKEAHTKGARHMEEVSKFIKFNNEKLEEMEQDRKERERQISELKNEGKTLNQKIEKMERSLDRHE